MCLTILLLLAPLALPAQSEKAVFLVRHAQDTLAVETMSHDGARLDASLRLRAPVVTLGQQVALSDSGTVRQIVTTVSAGARGDSLVQRGVLTIFGDSALSHVEDARLGTRQGDRYVRIPAGAVPFVNLSGLSLELILRRARALGGDTARVPVILVGGQSAVATVMRNGADSVLLALGIAVLRARTDADGRFLGAVVPSQDVVFERLPGDSPVAAWRPDAVSYAAPAGAPYVAEDVKLHTPAGLALVGTLTMPTHAAGARVPAVVMITGSGAQDRDEGSPALPRWRPFRDIADTLSRRGIAVLRLDDRGVGGSDAGPATATSADFADDIRAALAWLRTRADVDPHRLGLVGHSEGAVIAPMIAATDSTLRALVLIAGTASRGDSILEMQRRYLLSRDTSLTPAKRDSLLRLADAAADSAYRAPGWLHYFASYDPLPTARRVRTPTLILQ
ncbi:MAG TPA: alpha/beta fold hydrolase, partial [Gemmatimonadaceae bacterium]|nr:alpha/beta fold hydrolase [Gemmatimonadaceae bacterium]